MYWRTISVNETKVHCVLSRHCRWIPEHPLSQSYVSASGFIGQCGMRSVRPGQGVAVVGACKEKGGSSPLPPPLPLDPSLVLLSLLDLSLSAFSDCRPGILQCHCTSKSDRESLQSFSAVDHALNKCSRLCAAHACKCRSSSLPTFCADRRHVKTWADTRR